MRNHVIGILALLFMTGCSLQKDSFLAGLSVASEQVSEQPNPRAHFPESVVFAVEKNPLILAGDDRNPGINRIEDLSAVIEKGELRRMPSAATSSKSIRILPSPKELPEDIHQIELIRPKITEQLKEQEIPIDRNLALTLLTIGSAAMMWGYTSFSLLGFALVFLSSLAVTPAMHSLIWKEPLNWQKSRLGRVALSMVLSGLVLSGIVAMLANFLGWVF